MTDVYIAGPMRGLPDFNYPAFHSLEAWIDRKGLPGIEYSAYPVNPAKNFGGDTSREYAEYMRVDLPQLAQCDAIVLLPGWRKSVGARLEVEIARHLGLAFYRAECKANGKGWIIVRDRALDARIVEPDYDPAHDDAMTAERAGYDAEPLAAWERELLDDGTLTTFASGATRDTSAGKLDFEGFYHPTVVARFAQYMDKNRVQSDGNLRDSDNWQKGFTRTSYMKSMFRHFMDVWTHHRKVEPAPDASLEDALCAVIFNAQGYLFELLQGRDL